MSSQYLSEKFSEMIPYRLGEQPTDKKYIKLNSNETSFPASPLVSKVLKDASLNLLGFYSDQDGTVLREALSCLYQVTCDQVLVGNGADEMLSFCFLAYGETRGFSFPDISYGFYKTFLRAFQMEYEEIPLNKDFTVDLEAFKKSRRHIVLANPNAPTGLCLTTDQIKNLLESDTGRIVIIDEAYLGYGANSCMELLSSYKNLIIVHTMSKSRNIAALHVGYAIANEDIIQELSCIKNCFNPNNLNQITLDAAVAAVKDQDYTEWCCRQKVLIRDEISNEMKKMGFTVIPSSTNFIFFTHPLMNANDLEKKLREYGILVRYYPQERISNYIRMTIGTREEMEYVLKTFKNIL